MKDYLINLSCDGCPALPLRTDLQLDKINNWRSIHLSLLKQIIKPKLILLCESFPQDRYIYDQQTSYTGRGLRYNLKKELYNKDISDEQFLANLSADKILIIDCAFCPLHQKENGNYFLTNTQKRQSATTCLKRHNLHLLHRFPEAPIITIFPRNRGFLKRELPEVASRIKAQFDFSKLEGLRQRTGRLGLRLSKV
jgi:hypothetical protein